MCTLPQIYKLFKTKNTTGVSLWSYILLLSGAICSTIYGFTIKAVFVESLGIYDTLAASLIIFLILKYRKIDLYPKTLI